MAYVDAYVLPCPEDKVAAYRRLARKAGAVWNPARRPRSRVR